MKREKGFEMGQVILLLRLDLEMRVVETTGGGGGCGESRGLFNDDYNDDDDCKLYLSVG